MAQTEKHQKVNDHSFGMTARELDADTRNDHLVDATALVTTHCDSKESFEFNDLNHKQNHACYVMGHVIKSSRLSPCISGEEPGYEATVIILIER